MAELERCEQVYQPGLRVVIGTIADPPSYAIWLVGGGPAIATFSPDESGWTQAWDTFARWEPQPAAPAYAGSHVGTWSGAGVFVVLAVLYLAFHAFKYHDCLSSPGIFSWPSQCI